MYLLFLTRVQKVLTTAFFNSLRNVSPTHSTSLEMSSFLARSNEWDYRNVGCIGVPQLIKYSVSKISFLYFIRV